MLAVKITPDNPAYISEAEYLEGEKIAEERHEYSNSRYPSVIRASQICEGFDFYRHNHTLQALKACPNTA